MPPYPHYDRCRRPRGGAPAAASTPSFFPETELAPPCLEEALRRGALAKVILMIFIIWVLTLVHVRFNRAIISLVFMIPFNYPF
jgi:hypothetical protein